jgi:hypothetical protein
VDVAGFFTMPHFLVEYENLGNVPLTFSDFELVLPRFEKVSSTGDYKLQLGAELFIDKRPTARIGPIQHLRAIDYRTNTVRLEPGASYSDFFDLGAFVEGADPKQKFSTGKLPPDFEPVLTFRDSFANRYWVNAEGVHAGRYEAPMAAAIRAGGRTLRDPQTVTSRRRLIRWLGWDYGKVTEQPKPLDPSR